MHESATPQSGLSPNEPEVPSLSEEARVPCERCGTFLLGAPRKIGPRRVCKACARLLRDEIALYPTGYIYVWGILINVTFAGIFAAINWKRLGNRTRMWNAVIVAVCGVVWTLIAINLPNIACAGFIINLIGTRIAAQTLDEEYERHKKEGGARASLLWPVIISLGAMMLLVVAIFAIAALTPGGLLPEID
ncbi:hypothetical protein [Vitiosangium sp. GDMCC 1.1324]|uniref:hypothetical protein n=1 Tax=Vitiosangium sp. (strain GDMCC 1.1324) TaxID=2138576 RepID=UPI000D3BFDF5|nr:hypothetical protein [Vitiosangium sp. GDMCC 1.1324]PTL78527.1 hypothetical protein DAT35_39065 [Vitiosangium sp. GDMCC 1.1324]